MPTSPHALRTTAPRRSAVAALHRRGGFERTGLDGVLADLDRAAAPCEVPGDAAGEGFAWDARDQADTTWWPQGVACLRGGDVVLVGWYAKRGRGGRTPGARLTVVDRSDPARPRYRHVLLVAPRPAPLARVVAPAPVPVHAGGIAVVGGLLLVADTIAGVRVFDLDDVARAPGPRHGHDLVLPQLRRLRVPLLGGTGRLRYSFLSVGEVTGSGDARGGDLSLVVGEYRRAGAGSPRLLRYRVDPVTGLPVAGPDGRCSPVEVHEGAPPRMQGVAVHGSTWWITASSGQGRAGDLHVGAPGALHRHRGVLPPGPEDLAWSRPGHQLWSVTEWPGKRWVFPVDARRWAPPAASSGGTTADPVSGSGPAV